jgi:hypothetical protein
LQERYYGYGEHVKEEEEAGQFRELMREFLVNNGGASNPQEFVPMLRWTREEADRACQEDG